VTAFVGRVLTALAMCALAVVSAMLGQGHTSVADRAPSPVARSMNFGLAYGDTMRAMSANDLSLALDDAVTTGARWVRFDLSWALVQPDSGNTYVWEDYDRVVDAALARRLTLLPTLAYTPSWARPSGCTTDKCAPRDPADFARFASAAARRYSQRGVTTWEIWNEPNSTFWLPYPNAKAYFKLLQLTGSEIRKVDPTATLLLGGLAAVPSDSSHVSQIDFLYELCQLGANKIVNAVAYHPYTYPFLASYRAPWETAWNRIDQTPVSLRSVLKQFGTPRLPIWLTEYGAPTGGPGKPSDGSPSSISSATTHVTEAYQARIAKDAVVTAAADRNNIQALIWYADRDLSEPGDSNEKFYGLRRADGSKKKGFDAYAAAIREAR
jgi:hypothetical protein